MKRISGRFGELVVNPQAASGIACLPLCTTILSATPQSDYKGLKRSKLVSFTKCRELVSVRITYLHLGGEPGVYPMGAGCTVDCWQNFTLKNLRLNATLHLSVFLSVLQGFSKQRDISRWVGTLVRWEYKGMLQNCNAKAVVEEETTAIGWSWNCNRIFKVFFQTLMWFF